LRTRVRFPPPPPTSLSSTTYILFGVFWYTRRYTGEKMSRKSTPSYLLDRPSGYYFRVRVPHDLKDHLNRSEIKTSIGHTSRSQALKVARRLSVITESLFDEIRENPMHLYDLLYVFLDMIRLHFFYPAVIIKYFFMRVLYLDKIINIEFTFFIHW